MFRRSKVPQRKEFSFTSEQVDEDISSIKSDPNQIEKLYLCLDKVRKPKKKLQEMEEFLQGTDKLADYLEDLKTQKEQLYAMKEELLKRKADLESRLNQS